MGDVSNIVLNVTDFTRELLRYTVEEFLMFSVFKESFNKTYPSAPVEKKSILNFLLNQRSVTTHNKNYSAGLVSFSLGLNSHSDMSTKESNRLLNGFRLPVLSRALKDEEIDFVLSESLNWVSKGFVTKGSLIKV